MKKIILSLLFASLFVFSYAQTCDVIATETAEDATTVTIQFKLVSTGTPFPLGGVSMFYTQSPLLLDLSSAVVTQGELTTPDYTAFRFVQNVNEFFINSDINSGPAVTIDGTGKILGTIKFTKLGSGTLELVYDNRSEVLDAPLAPGVPITLDNPFTITNILLPLEWLSFKATSITSEAFNKVALTWETASEKDVTDFNVERSEDGKVFTKIGAAIPANNKVTKSSYTAYDDKPLNGVSYYRIRQTDTDGKTTVTKIESVTLNSKKAVGKFTFYPNPIQKGTPLSILTDVQGAFDFKVIDMMGRVMYNQKLQGNTELKGLTLAGGTYLYEILSGDQRVSGKIFVAE